mmetsp:Transcript_6766/g.10296  ORF Transcript_6766/g.10296 Transcript_6766/m.10296 type:complete len:169 (+) Transcript_6766:105-611(+)
MSNNMKVTHAQEDEAKLARTTTVEATLESKLKQALDLDFAHMLQTPSGVAKFRGMNKKNDDDDDDDVIFLDDNEIEESNNCVLSLDVDAWLMEPIWKLPPVIGGEFEGQRPLAKAMARELAALWEITDKSAVSAGAKSRRDAGGRRGGKTKMKGLGSHRKRSRTKDDW